ncbi:hypothetical protein SAMN05443144_10494 [Fodinibius roseus]|uniref:Uncharacterized protein n=1 Tax=Fodinibius roseus TaxID=1194090 RepID=A0A1M4XDQ3_9BACT|nr:hypothetical protein SAMN05443144_10494 [Fodinibius roseus]
MREVCETALVANLCIFFAHSKPPHMPYVYAEVLNALRLLIFRL